MQEHVEYNLVCYAGIEYGLLTHCNHLCDPGYYSTINVVDNDNKKSVNVT